MGQLFAYSLQASILLLAMYLIYRWMLANENQNRFNRGVLLLIYAMSFATFPLLNLLPQAESTPLPTATLGNITLVPTVTVTAEPLFSPWRIVLWVYVAGMAIVALGTLVNIIRLCVIILKGRILHVDDCTLVLVKDKDMSPFSWLHFIVMNEADYERSGEMIISHEEQHIHCHHWADLLLAQAVIILCWFNPAAWLMRKELQTVHEYEADQCVLDDGVNARDYQMLLLKMAVGARFPSFANSLNHSIIKKRITMMNNQSTDARRRIRVLALAPALVLAVLATNIPCVASTLSAATTTTLVSEDGSKGSNNSANEQIKDEQLNRIVQKVKDTPDGTGEVVNTIKLNANVTLDDKQDLSSLRDSITYIVDGKEVESIADLKAEDIASMNINKQGKKPIVEIITKKAQAGSTDQIVGEGALNMAEQMPEYPGGQAALIRFLGENVKYPVEAKEKGIQGRAICQFVVERDGSISEVTVMRSSGDASLDAEAVRVVKSMPKWKPGKHEGKTVRVRYVIPINFQL